MNTVYLVYIDLEDKISFEYSETVLIGVYSTEEKAQEAQDLATQDFQTTDVVSDTWILPVEVDTTFERSFWVQEQEA